jgi:hypothetical protein
MRVVALTDDRVLLNDDGQNKLISFPVNSIIQIEIDRKYREYEPHNHYTVNLDRSNLKG